LEVRTENRLNFIQAQKSSTNSPKISARTSDTACCLEVREFALRIQPKKRIAQTDAPCYIENPELGGFVKNLIGLFVIALCTLSFAHANDAVSYRCSNITSGNGSLFVTLSKRSMKKASVSVINASGYIEITGSLDCSGPQEAAYVCTGNLTSPAPTDAVSEEATLVIPESLLQASAGIVRLDAETEYSCSLAK
jgi:hypothetical protein